MQARAEARELAPVLARVGGEQVQVRGAHCRVFYVLVREEEGVPSPGAVGAVLLFGEVGDAPA